MNILLTYHELGFRGGERLFASLSKGLIEVGNNATVVVGRINKDKTDFLKVVNIIKPQELFNKLFKNNWIFATLSFPVTFINIFKVAKGCDIIYAGESYVSLWPSVVVSKILGKKLALSVFELGKKYKSPIGFRGFLHAIWSVANNFFVKKINYAVTINTSLIPLLKKKYGIKNVYSIPAGLDFSIFSSPKPTDVLGKYNLYGKKIILMQGTLHPQKRQDLAIKALKIVQKKVSNAVLIIAGGGDESYLTKLRNLVSDLKLEKCVVFTGFVPDGELKNFYAASDVCLMCGPIAGLTIIEALYFGKLTVYPTSGNPPLGPVEEYKLGVITNHQNEKEFAEKLVDIIKTPKKHEKKSLEESRFVKKQFSLKTFTDATFKLLQTLAREK